MSPWTIGWLIWIAGFLAIELPAIWLGPKDGSATLSGHVWSWFRVRDRRPTVLTWVLRAPLYAFLIWLAGHLAFGWWSA